MDKKLLFFCFLFNALFVWSQSQLQTIEIKGTVSDGLLGLVGVNVLIDGGIGGTKTDDQGKYAISAAEGDLLLFTHIGYEPLEIIVEDVDRVINLTMVPAIEYLDNVTVTKRVRKTQEKLFLEYNSNPNLIKTQFGILDKETSGTALYIIAEEDINAIATNILAAIQGKFPGVKISPKGNPDLVASPWDRNAVVYIRGGGSLNNPTPTIFEIDGSIYLDPPLFLNVANIKRIAALPSFAAAARYGNIAAGGIIIVNTKSGNFSPKKGAIDAGNNPLALDNDFENDAIDYGKLAQEVPVYLEALQTSRGLVEAKEEYLEYKQMYGGLPHFFLDVYQYFHKKGDVRYADTVIASHFDLFENNPIALKALAYTYEVQGRKMKAHQVYKDIFVLRPNYAQSYLDLATSYTTIGQYKKAAAIYARYKYLLEQNFVRPEAGFDGIFDRAYDNLLKRHGEGLIGNRMYKNKSTDVLEDYPTRLVFEWNDSEAEFELQFVNPSGKHVIVEHSLFANAEHIKNQKLTGYATEEYLVDDAMLGEWQVNTRYLGNKSLTPTYLKVTIYQNYGSRAQHKDIKLFKLDIKNVNQKLFTFIRSASMSSN